MSAVETENFIWSPKDIIGKGATAIVYSGRHKLSGKIVAIKTFSQAYASHSELNVLRNLNHRNIVSLIAVENIYRTQNFVIIMEICTGGNLFTLIDNPDNMYGFEETECLRIISDVTAGMNHLREKQIAHRDIKPGNIMCSVAENGLFTYKLCDFGTARVLKEEQQFMSLHGTEEYLHPYIYERACLRHQVADKPTALVDLWSLGVTFYQIITGQLPFRAHGGRNDRHTMHQIISKKSREDISGIQSTASGPIVWSKRFPDFIHHSLDFRRIMETILVGVLQTEHKNCWSFSHFFDQIQNTLKHVIIHVFILHQSHLDRVYLDGDGDYHELLAKLRKNFKIRDNHAISLFFNNNELHCPSTLACLPPTTPQNPITVLVDLQSQFPPIQHEKAYADCSFPLSPSPNTQYIAAKEIISRISQIERSCEKNIVKESHTKAAIEALISTTCEELKQTWRSTCQRLEQCKTTDTALALFHESHLLFERQVQDVFKGFVEGKCVVDKLASLVNKRQEEFKEVKFTLSELSTTLQNLHDHNISNGSLMNFWKANEPLSTTENAFNIVKTIHKESLTIYSRFKTIRNLPYPDDFEQRISEYDRRHLISMYNKSREILKNQSQRSLEELHSHASNTFTEVVKLDKQIVAFQSDIESLSEALMECTENLNNAQADYRLMVEDELLPLFSTQLQPDASFNSRVEAEVRKRTSTQLRTINRHLNNLKFNIEQNSAMVERLMLNNDANSEASEASSNLENGTDSFK